MGNKESKTSKAETEIKHSKRTNDTFKESISSPVPANMEKTEEFPKQGSCNMSIEDKGSKQSPRATASREDINESPKLRLMFAEIGNTFTFDVKLDELTIQNKQSKESLYAMCDLCLHNELYTPLGDSLCIECGLYLCTRCANKHGNCNRHQCLSESNMKEIQKRLFTEVLNETDRRKEIKAESVSMSDAIDVIHELDNKTCDIRGLCGMDNNLLAVCDYGNKCVKIINQRSRMIERYFSFDSKPFDATVVDIKRDAPEVDPTTKSESINPQESINLQNSIAESDSKSVSDLALKSDSKSLKVPNMSILYHDAPSKDRALAVTFPHSKQILYIDINKNPALRARTITIGSGVHPYHADFVDGKLYVLGYKIRSSIPICFIYILTINGVVLKELDTKIRTDMCFISHYSINMCVSPGRIYISDSQQGTITCLDDTGELTKVQRIGNRNIRGMTTDLNNTIYLSEDYRVYERSCDLDNTTLLLDTGGYKWLPGNLCYYRDKLYVDHRMFPRNRITVIRMK